MAAPGLGVGDICKACQMIYTICKRYRDAHDEFDEISAKAKSTEIVLQRLEVENQTGGNIVERAGPQAFEQLNDNLASLRQDSEKLETLVRKYQKIEQDGPGRRLLWALKESSNLTDLRRRIGYHEQTLQLWYMTIVYGSLRRLESGQEEIIEGIKGIPRYKLQDILDALHKGDKTGLEHELRKSGVSRENIDVNLTTAIDYLNAPPIEKVRMESEARSKSATMRAETRQHSFVDPVPFPTEYSSNEYRSKSSQRKQPYDLHPPPYIPEPSRSKDKDPIIIPITQVNSKHHKHHKRSASQSRDPDPDIIRSKSTSPRPKDSHDKSPIIIPISEVTPKHHKRTNSTSQPKETFQPRETSLFLTRSKSTSSRPKESYGKYTDHPGLHIHDSRRPSPSPSPSDKGASDKGPSNKSPPDDQTPDKARQPRPESKTYVVVRKDSSRPRRASDALVYQSTSERRSTPSSPRLEVPPSPRLEVPPSPNLAVPDSQTEVQPPRYYHYHPDSGGGAGSGEGSGTHRRTRSATDVRQRLHDDGERVIVVEEVRSRSRRRREEGQGEGSRSRDSSTHSYVRVRRGSEQGSSASEVGSDFAGRRGRRVVQKMDRIDSIPLEEGKKGEEGRGKGKGKGEDGKGK